MASIRENLSFITADSTHVHALCYVQEILSEMSRCEAAKWSRQTVGSLPEQIFDILTCREFCYLSKSKVAPYRPEVLRQIRLSIERGVAIPFYLDLGGGYHASLVEGGAGLCFEPGLGELMVLQQAARFRARVREVYGPGIQFTIVIDNLCALLVNDIPVGPTERYCASLRRMIEAAGVEAWAGLLVESENFTPDQYPAEGQIAATARPVTANEHGNVERFLGRPCSPAEASLRVARYAQIGACSEHLLGTLIDGVHMTQRASSTTLCFRAFPGSDCRIQAGEVALQIVQQAGVPSLKPFLLTSRNAREHDCSEVLIPTTAGGHVIRSVLLSRAAPVHARVRNAAEAPAPSPIAD